MLSGRKRHKVQYVHASSRLASVRKHVLQEKLQRHDPRCLRWHPNTLYDRNGHDTDVCVLDMLHRAVSPTKITDMLQNLHEHNLITDDKRKNLLQIVLARTGGIIHLDPIFQESVHQMVLSHNELSQDLAAL